MNSILIALISAVGTTGVAALISFLSSRNKNSSDFKMEQFKDGTEVRREYLDQIKQLTQDKKDLEKEIDAQRVYGETWRDKWRETDSEFKEYKYKYIVQESLKKDAGKIEEYTKTNKEEYEI